MAKLKKEVDGWIVPYCVRVPATGNGQEKEKKGKDDNRNNEKTMVLYVFYIFCGNRVFQKCWNCLVIIDVSEYQENREKRKRIKS